MDNTAQIARDAVVTPMMVYLYERDRSLSLSTPSRLLSYFSAQMFTAIFRTAVVVSVNQSIEELVDWAGDDIERKRQVLPQLFKLEALLDNVIKESD